MKLLQAFVHSDIRKVVLDFLYANELVLVFCSCLSLRLPFVEDIQDVKQCYLSWINSSGIDARLLQILACPVTRNAVMDFLYARELVLTFLSCRTLKKGFLDDIEDIRKCWLCWWDTQRDKWLKECEMRKIKNQTSERCRRQELGLTPAEHAGLVLGPLGLQTEVPLMETRLGLSR